VAAVAGVIAACAPSPTAPDTTPGPTPPSGGGTQPSPPPATAPSPLIGTWRGVTTVFAPTIQTVTWRFSGDGTCLQTFVTITDTGLQYTTDRPCTWTADRATVTVTYAGVAGPVVFNMSYSFPDQNRLRLDADEFDRVG
jgi:hypothetical protein